jgi:hypothetical protein
MEYSFLHRFHHAFTGSGAGLLLLRRLFRDVASVRVDTPYSPAVMWIASPGAMPPRIRRATSERMRLSLI